MFRTRKPEKEGSTDYYHAGSGCCQYIVLYTIHDFPFLRGFLLGQADFQPKSIVYGCKPCDFSLGDSNFRQSLERRIRRNEGAEKSN